jgi:hypothetical protein
MQPRMPAATGDRNCVEAREALRKAIDRRPSAYADPLSMFFKRSTTPETLSREQRRFGEEHEATPGMHAGGRGQLVFFYRHERSGTHRWLVDADGEVVDFVSLR